MLEKCKRLLGHPQFIPVLCLTLAAVIILFAGPYIALAGYVPLASLVVRLLLCILLVAGYLTYKYIQHLKSLQKQDDLVKEISADDGAEQAIGAEAKDLQEKFRAAFDVLKQSKSSNTPLTAIPWYMIIGSPGAGKTTLLSNSGLNFPLSEKLGNKPLKGVGGTKNCDWWITREAVLLDTAGRYASQDSFQKVDESGWMNFLSLIKRYRKKPISGLIVSISMTDLINLNEYELSQQVLQIRQRIAEVNDYFNTRFPVYLTITKTDMLAGFSQFFETFSHQEREQAFGITFDTTSQDDCGREFGRQFAALCNSVSRRQWTRLSVERDTGRKSLLYSFCEQLGSLKQPLSAVVSQLTATEDDASVGILRGVYFTSGVQSGAPIDRMVARVSQVLGLRTNERPLWNNDQRSYFIKDLLQQIVFAEADRFGTLARYELRKIRLKQFSLGAFAVLSLITCLGLFSSYQNNADYLTRANLAVDAWLEQFESPEKSASELESVRVQLPALNSFLSQINGLDDVHQSSFSGMGLDQSRAMQNALQSGYFRLLNTVLLPFVQLQLEAQLKDSANPLRQYQALKTYLMLADQDGFRNDDYIESFLTHYLNQDALFSPSEFLLLTPHIRSMVAGGITINRTDSQLVEGARRVLRAQPLDEIYYREFKDAESVNPANYLSMAQLAGSNWRVLMSTTLDDIQTIQTMFTPERFSQVVDKDIPRHIRQLADEAWVLGEASVIDEDASIESVRTLYAQDYVDSWQALLDGASIRSVSEVTTLNSNLQLLTRLDSPIFALLSSVSEATELVSALPGGAGTFVQQTNEQISRVRQQAQLEKEKFFVTSQFSKLHEIMQPERRTALEQGLASLVQEVSVAISFQLQSPNNPSQSIPLSGLQGFGYLQINPLNRWIGELARGVQLAQNQLRKRQWEQLWQAQVQPSCLSIVEAKYPFQRVSKVDASSLDLVQMFAPSGSVFRFFNSHLAEFINTQTSPWQWRGTAQSDFQFSSEVLTFFETAFKVQQTLFKSSGNQPATDYSVTPVYLDPRLARLRMNIYGTRLDYQFGRPTPTVVKWPPSNRVSTSTISFVRRDGSEIVATEQGMFALNRLIESADIKRLSPSKIEVTFEHRDFKTIFEIAVASPEDPMLFNLLSEFQCLSRL